jgi:hypothetical protein
MPIALKGRQETQERWLDRYPPVYHPQILAAVARLAARLPALLARAEAAALAYRRDERAQDCQADHDLALWEGELRR